MLTGAGRTMVWDVENRPVSITAGNVTATFVYDGDGNRALKTEGGQTVLYINKYLERNLTTSENTAHYFLGSRQIAIRNGSTLSYLHQDMLGGTSIVSDGSGTSMGTTTYLPFGGLRLSSGTMPTDKKFTGQRLDGTGLYYYGARYYDPSIGRFISPDPIIPDFRNPQSLNRYSYAYNNPLAYNDPTGHFPWLAVLAVVNIVVNYASIAYDVYQVVREPSWQNIAFLALDLFDPTPFPHGAINQTARHLSKAVIEEAAQQAGKEVAEVALPLAKMVDDAPASLLKGENDTYVYLGKKNGEPNYVGITNDLPRREAQHGDRFDELAPMSNEPMTRNQARAIEQSVIETNPQFSNQINSVSPAQPYYNEWVEWGNMWLELYGYMP